ncbi:hypothetical protein M9H77_21789 [Catharanthus roseus]|uniref:Uncharacterized protein n=1 Tax=Catharanthus roseus TaxID=4058 RepID=A0ACC0APC1_CATRO|nr:hypothetical protein M9H77_21789 [Catharanthus roseus]
MQFWTILELSLRKYPYQPYLRRLHLELQGKNPGQAKKRLGVGPGGGVKEDKETRFRTQVIVHNYGGLLVLHYVNEFRTKNQGFEHKLMSFYVLVIVHNYGGLLVLHYVNEFRTENQGKVH